MISDPTSPDCGQPLRRPTWATASLLAERVIGWLGPATTLRLHLVIESWTHLVLALARSPLLVGMVLAPFGFGSLSLGAVAGGVLAARYGLTAPFWCSFAVMTLLTLACWPILSTRAVAQTRAQAPTGTGRRLTPVRR